MLTRSIENGLNPSDLVEKMKVGEYEIKAPWHNNCQGDYTATAPAQMAARVMAPAQMAARVMATAQKAARVMAVARVAAAAVAQAAARVARE